MNFKQSYLLIGTLLLTVPLPVYSWGWFSSSSSTQCSDNKGTFFVGITAALTTLTTVGYLAWNRWNRATRRVETPLSGPQYDEWIDRAWDQSVEESEANSDNPWAYWSDSNNSTPCHSRNSSLDSELFIIL